MEIEREHFAFLRSYWEQIKLLPSKKQKSEIFEAICSVQFFEKDVKNISFSNQNQMILWEGLKPILKQSQKGYSDKMGLRGANPREGGTQAPCLHKDKDKDKDEELKKNKQKKLDLSEIQNHKLKENILEFIEHRKDIKKPFTQLALKKFISKVNRFVELNYDIGEIIDNSITANYPDIYEPKQNKPTNTFSIKNKVYKEEDF